MKPGLQIIGRCLAVCMISCLTWAAPASAILRNGGVVILHSNLQVCPEAPLDNTLVVVASDSELATLRRDFPGGIDKIQITLDTEHSPSTTFTAALQWVDQEQLVGQVALTGQPIHVVSHAYATRRHWIPSCF